MKKVLFAITIMSLATACTKSKPDALKTTSKVFLQVEGVDYDNATTTVSPILTVNVTQ
jgi:hypothetical protein